MDNKEPFDREKFIEAVGILAQAWENAFRGAIVGVNNMLANLAPLYPVLLQWERRRALARQWAQYREARQ